MNMTKSIESDKLKVINWLMQIEDEQSIRRLQEAIAEIDAEREKRWAAVKPIRKQPSIEQMMEEQNYQPMSKEEFYRRTEAVDVQEPLEELLEMLNQ